MVLMVFLWRIYIYIGREYRDKKTGEAGYHFSSLSTRRSIKYKREEEIKFE